MQFGVNNNTDILDGRCQFVWQTKAWILNDKWRNMPASEVYKKRLFVIAVDEVHVAYK